MDKIQSALLAIPTPADRGKWLTLTMAYKADGGDYETWDAWSARGDNYNERANKSTWDSIEADGGITAATLYQEAYANGWKWNNNDDDVLKRLERIRRQRNRQSDEAPRTAATANQMNPSATPAIRQYIAEAAQHQAEILTYAKERGLSDQTISRFRLGYDSKEKRLVIPYPETSYYVSRSMDIAPNGDKGKAPKYKYPKKEEAGDKPLFNLPALRTDKPFIAICEGQIDAMTLEQYGIPAVATTETGTLIRTIETNGKPKADFLYIPDNDQEGANKSTAMLEALTEKGIEAYIYQVPTQYHDVNDFHIKAPADCAAWTRNAGTFFADIQDKNRQQYQQITGANRLPAFLASIKTSRTAIATGYPTLDIALGDGFTAPGGLFPGLYIIGGISSIGKTTFFLQMADQIAASRAADCLIFSLEMASGELIAKSISRLTAQLTDNEGDRKTVRGIMQGNRYPNYSPAERELIDTATEQYRAFAERLYIIEGIGNIGTEQIRQQVEKHIKATGRAPVVFIDYLQIIAPVDMKATDKQNTDRAVMELKRISRDFDTSVIAISSFNRENYNKAVSLASFKESGAIEYSSDVLLGLQFKGAGNDFDADTAKQQDPREIELKILKNRNGATGAVIPFKYFPKFNLYHDTNQGHEYQPPTSADHNNFTDYAR